MIKDIYYLTPEFKEFIYPLSDEDIFEELFDITTFLPFSNVSMIGFPVKEIPKILIAVKIKSNGYSDFSELICQLSLLLNSVIYEHLKHYINLLIFYNSFQYGKRQITLEESPGINEERKLINSILLKNRNMNVVFLSEGSTKVDVLLYGNILRKINFSQLNYFIYIILNFKFKEVDYMESFFDL